MLTGIKVEKGKTNFSIGYHFKVSLYELGVTEDQINTMLLENPKQLFSVLDSECTN